MIHDKYLFFCGTACIIITTFWYSSLSCSGVFNLILYLVDISLHFHSYQGTYGLISSEDLIVSGLDNGIADVLPFAASSLFCSIDTPRLDMNFVCFSGHDIYVSRARSRVLVFHKHEYTYNMFTSGLIIYGMACPNYESKSGIYPRSPGTMSCSAVVVCRNPRPGIAPDNAKRRYFSLIEYEGI